MYTNKFRPRVEVLGDRITPAQYYFNGGDTNVGDNWKGKPAEAPAITANDEVIITAGAGAVNENHITTVGKLTFEAGWGDNGDDPAHHFQTGGMTVNEIDFKGVGILDINGTVVVKSGLIDIQNKSFKIDATGGILYLSGDWNGGTPKTLTIDGDGTTHGINFEGDVRLGGYGGIVVVKDMTFTGFGGANDVLVITSTGGGGVLGSTVRFEKDTTFANVEGIHVEGDGNVEVAAQAGLVQSQGYIKVMGGAEFVVKGDTTDPGRVDVQGSSTVMVSGVGNVSYSVLVTGSTSRFLLAGGDAEVNTTENFMVTDSGVLAGYDAGATVSDRYRTYLHGNLYLYGNGAVDFFTGGHSELNVNGDVTFRASQLYIEIDHAGGGTSDKITVIDPDGDVTLAADSSVHLAENGTRSLSAQYYYFLTPGTGGTLTGTFSGTNTVPGDVTLGTSGGNYYFLTPAG